MKNKNRQVTFNSTMPNELFGCPCCAPLLYHDCSGTPVGVLKDVLTQEQFPAIDNDDSLSVVYKDSNGELNIMRVVEIRKNGKSLSFHVEGWDKQ